MSETLIANIEHYRSDSRVRDLGEVFTPEKYISQMLELIESRHWKDENVFFFEPTCGHGNIVLSIFKKRVEALKRKYKRAGEKYPTYVAVANTVNTLWAIDICEKNVELTRARVFSELRNELEKAGERLPRKQLTEFLGHVMCALNWQISQNEALTALSSSDNAFEYAERTKTSKKWFRDTGHRPIDFQNTWVNHYAAESNGPVTPLLLRKAKKITEALLAGNKPPTYKEFKFVTQALQGTIKVFPKINVKRGA